MPGLTDRTADALANWLAGATNFLSLPAVFLGLFTALPNDAGTGATEVTGTGYARVQVAGTLAAGASFSAAVSTITLAAPAPAWLLALGTNGSGVQVYDLTNNKTVGTVLSISGTTVTLTANALNASTGAADSLAFSAFSAGTAAVGAEPATVPGGVTNGAAITMPQATADWTAGGASPVIGFGLFDALTVGNVLIADYVGAFKWLPFTCTLASPGVLTAPAHGFANGDPVVVTAKFGGTLPATAGSWAGTKTVASSATDSFTAGVNTTGTGSGLVRKILQQSIPANVTASFAASQLTLTAA